MIVTGISSWAKVRVDNYDKKFNKWTIDLTMDDKNAAILTAAGLKPTKIKKDEWTFKFKRDCVRKSDGVAKKVPAVVDAKNQPFTGLIGNGSLVRIQFAPIAYEKFGGGITHDLQGVQVIKLIEYSAGDGAEFEPVEVEETGAVVDEPATTEENPFV